MLRSISARKTIRGDEERNATNVVGGLPGCMPDNTDKANQRPGKEGDIGWLDWFSGLFSKVREMGQG